MSISPQNSRRGFTLVELLVVIAIIGILVGLLLPAVQAAREAARRAVCQNNIRQIALACTNYQSAHQRFPSGSSSSLLMLPSPAFPQSSSFLVTILPYMDQQPLYDELVSVTRTILPDPTGTATDIQASSLEMPLLVCPSASQTDAVDDLTGGEFASHYVGISGPGVPRDARNIPDIDGDDIIDVRVLGSSATGIARGDIGCDGVFSPFSTDRLVVMIGAGSTFSFTGYQGYRNNRGITFSDIGDGSSNTFAISEFSGGEFKASTPPYTPRRGSWSVGSSGFFNPATQAYVPSVDPSLGALTFQTKTVSFRLNSRTPAHYTDFIGCAPLNSSHSGGVNMARADGSVSFVDDTINLQPLQFQCGIDDGRVVTQDF